MIVAPADHGKTEVITDLLDKLPGRKLAPTHTNVGVSVLRQRLDRKQISQDKYSLSTISSFCAKWCGAYPVTAQIDSTIGITDKRFYKDQYCGAILVFSHAWARDVLLNTYACVIVDEYLDCIVE